MSVTKRRARTHHRQVIRADLTLVPDPLADLGEAVPAPASAGARAKTPIRRKPRNSKPFRRRRRFRPGRGQAEGQGRAIRCSSPAPSLALLDAYLRRDPPAAGALRARLALQSAAASAKILRLNTDEARAARPALRRRRPPGPAGAKLLSCGASSPAGRPASTPAGLPPRRRALDLAVDPNGARGQPDEAAQGRGSGLRRRQERPPWPLPPSRTPRPPTPRSSPFGRSTSSSRFGCAGRDPCR